jgi:uncharacterized protein YeaO (DUF488 family)
MTASRKLEALTQVEDESEPIEYSSPPCYLSEFETGRMAVAVPSVRIKRIYDQPDPSDGFRVLVDRLWPPGVTKVAAALDAWSRELAPSTELRRSFRREPDRWNEFRIRYRAELREHTSELEVLCQRASGLPVTLLYAAKDPEMNHAAILREILLER